MRRPWWLVSMTMLCALLISVFSVQLWDHETTASPAGREVNVISLVDTPALKSHAVVSAGVTAAIPQISIFAGDTAVTRQDVVTVSHIMQDVVTHVLAGDMRYLPRGNASVVLFGTEQGYSREVQKDFPANLTARVIQQTGGFTSGSIVYIPLYKYQDDAFLANTLTHELTHAQLNVANIGQHLPTWLDEGFAWYDGVLAQSTLNPQSVGTMTAPLLKGISAAQKDGSFAPLATDPSSVLLAHPTYNIEFQDYLAVQALIAGYGIHRFDAFLRDIPALGLDASFQLHYGFRLQHYMSAMNTLV